jgi:hypothetical protein
MADFITPSGAATSFGGDRYVELAGISSEEKPTGNFLSGSLFLEVDTGTVFFYNRAAAEWVEQFSFQ